MPSTTAAKCTFFYQQGSHGWTESYYQYGTPIPEAYLHALNLGNQLIALRGSNTAITALRIAEVLCPTNQSPAPRSSQLFPPAQGWGAGNAPVAGNITGGNQSDTFSASVLARCIPAFATPGVKSIFMGGFPDIYDQQGGIPQGGFVFNYGTVITRRFQQALWQGGFGWLGIAPATPPASVPIGALVTTTSGLIAINVTATLALQTALGSVQNGQVVPIRISGMRQPGNLNGTWPFHVTRVGAIYQLNSTRPFATLTWDGTGQITYSPKSFVPFISANVGADNPTPREIDGNIYIEKISRRKRGLPFGAQRGRQRAVARY
jgi:hypothetical protein